MSPAEREDSIPKRQRPAELNTALTIAGAYSGNGIATLTDDQKALHTAKLKELLNIDKFGVVEVVVRSLSQKNSLDKLGKNSGWTDLTKCDMWQELVLMQTASQERQSSLITAAIHENPVAFGDCHNAFHQSPMPSESEPV